MKGPRFLKALQGRYLLFIQSSNEQVSLGPEPQLGLESFVQLSSGSRDGQVKTVHVALFTTRRAQIYRVTKYIGRLSPITDVHGDRWRHLLESYSVAPLPTPMLLMLPSRRGVLCRLPFRLSARSNQRYKRACLF